MARHRKVAVVIWTDLKFCELSDDAKLLFLYLLTHPNQTSLGAMQATMGGLADERGWLPERLSKAFAEVTKKGMAKYNPRARCLWLPNFLKYNGPESPNVVKAWFGALDLIPECDLKILAIQRAKDILQDYDQAFAEAFDKAFAKAFPKGVRVTDGDPSPNPEQEQEPYPKQEQDQKKNIVEFRNSNGPATGELNLQPQEPSPPDPKKLRRASAERIFEHWKAMHGHERAQFDDKRLKLVFKALDSGYSEADLCQAITGYLNSPHHMGENDNSTKYDSIELMLRGSKFIDQGLKFYAEPPRTERSKLMRRNVSATAGWIPPEMRNAAK